MTRDPDPSSHHIARGEGEAYQSSRIETPRHEPEILEQFELVENTVSMEEAVQQQTETTPADVNEVSEH